MINIILTLSGCHFNHNEQSGTIASPNYPYQYPKDYRCYHHIFYTTGYRIRITFSFFDIKSSVDCKENSLKIYDGPSARSTIANAIQCGTSVPNTVKSTGAHYYLAFETSNQDPSQGFQLHYVACK